MNKLTVALVIGFSVSLVQLLVNVRQSAALGSPTTVFLQPPQGTTGIVCVGFYDGRGVFTNGQCMKANEGE